MYAKQEGDLRAYALMRRGNELEAEYVRSEFGHLNRANLDELRKALAFERYSDYRGIARAPFAEDYMVGPQGWEDDEPEDDPEPEARRVMNEFLGPNILPSHRCRNTASDPYDPECAEKTATV